MNVGWRIFSLASGAAAGFAAKKISDVIWEKGLSKDKPQGDETDLDIPLTQIVLFSVVTAAVNGLITEFVRRKTTQWYYAKEQ